MIKKMMLTVLAGLSMAAMNMGSNKTVEDSLISSNHIKNVNVKRAVSSEVTDYFIGEGKFEHWKVLHVPSNIDSITGPALGDLNTTINKIKFGDKLALSIWSVGESFENQLGNMGPFSVDELFDKFPSLLSSDLISVNNKVSSNIHNEGKFTLFAFEETDNFEISDSDLGSLSGQNFLYGIFDTTGVRPTTSMSTFLQSVSYESYDAVSGRSGSYFVFYSIYSENHIQDGQTADVYINVDDPLTIDQILANVSAEDLLGEEVEVECTEEEKAKYNRDQIGTYKITITATDKYDQTATCYLNIHVIDTVGPVISNPKALNFAVGDTLAFSDISTYITITDNGTSHGGTIGDATYKIDGQPFNSDKTFSGSDVGNHTLEVSVSDSSGNMSTKSFQITVRDTEAPVITMRDGGDGNLIIGLSRVLNFSKSEFLALFTATDNVTSSEDIVLDVEGDFIPTKVGEYDIKVIATDEANNKGEYTCHVRVDADLPPVFILSDALIGATAETPLSSAQLQQIVTNGLYGDKEVLSVKLDDTDYQANATKKGSYPVAYTVSYKASDGSIEEEDGYMTIKVDSSAGEEDTEEKSGWQKFCDWWTIDFVEFWEKLGNWFKGVFTKFEWDCFITNEEWENGT